MEVLIVGAGAMGRWFARSIDTPVAFADVDEQTAAAAAEATGGRHIPLESDEPFEAVCLAVPMGHVEAAIEAHASQATAALIDVSGVMATPLTAMAKHAPDRERVSLHPLFAPERAPGSIAVVRDNPGDVTTALLAELTAQDNDLVETTAAEHDEAMESVQAAAHAAVLAFAHAAERVPDGFETPVYEGLRELATQVTGGTPRVYTDIQRAFDGADAVAAAADQIATADDETLEDLYREATAKWATQASSPDQDPDNATPNGAHTDE